MNDIRRLAVASIALTGVLAIPVLAQDEADSRLLTSDDLLALKSVGGPQISPDRQWVAYTINTVDAEADDSSTQVYMVSRDGEEVLQMTSDDYSAGSPHWSPDGRYLGFIAAKGEGDDVKSQVWLLDRRGGESRQYTSVDQGVSDFSWSPDGEKMLLMIQDKSATQLAEEAAEEAGEEAKPLPYVIDRLQFKQDGMPYLDRSRT